MGRFATILACALLGNVQAFATTGAEIDSNAPEELSDDAIKFIASWMASMGGKRRKLEENDGTIDCTKESGVFQNGGSCFGCNVVTNTFLNPNPHVGVANDNVITKEELAKTLEEFVCTIQKYTCPAVQEDIVEKLVAKEAQNATVFTGYDLSPTSAANQADCDYINWIGGGSGGSTDRCVGMAVCNFAFFDSRMALPPTNWEALDWEADGSLSDIPRESQMGSLLCGLESTVDLMYLMFKNMRPQANFYGPNTAKNCVGDCNFFGLNCKSGCTLVNEDVGIKTESIVQKCFDENWLGLYPVIA